MMKNQRRSGQDRRPEPLRRQLHVLHRRERHQRLAQHRPDVHPPEAPLRASWRRGDHPGPAAKVRDAPRHQGLSPDPSHDPDRRTAHQERCISSRCRTPTCRSSTAGPPRCSTRCGRCPGCRMSIRISRSPARRSSSRSIGTRPRPGHHRPANRECLGRRLRRRRQVSTIYTPTNEYWVDHGAPAPSTRNDPADISLLYVRSASGQLVPLDTVAKLTRASAPSR